MTKSNSAVDERLLKIHKIQLENLKGDPSDKIEQNNDLK